MSASFPTEFASPHPQLRNAQEGQENFPRIQGYLEAKSYERAQAELIYEFRHDHSNGEESKWLALCSFYDTLVQAQGFQRPLFHAFLAFLKPLLPSFPCANDKLIDAVQAFIKSSPQLTLPVQIEIFLCLHALCKSPASQKRLCTLLNELLQEMPIFNSLPLSLRTAEELNTLTQAGQRCLGQATSCLRFLVSQSTNDSALQAKSREVLGKIDSHSYFPAKIQATLKQFRESFQRLFEQTFPVNTRASIDPKLVRDFQKKVCRQFKENFLDALLALPLAILNLKKIPTEFWVCGSLAREEIVLFSDLEGLFVLEDGSQLEERGQLFKRLLEWIHVLTVSLGETPTSIEDKGLLSLVAHPCRKGFALDSLPNCAVSPLREINASLSSLPVYTLSTLSLLQQEKKLIEQEKEHHAALLETEEKRIQQAHLLQLQNLLERQGDEDAKREVQAFLTVIANPAQYKQCLVSLKTRQELSLNLRLKAIYQKVRSLKKEKKRNITEALATHEKKEQTIATLKQQLDHEETHIFLFSLLRARPLISTGGASFAYQATLKALLDEPIDLASGTRRQQKVATLLKLDQDSDAERWSEAHLQKMLSQPVLDLKQTFVKPLVYHLTTLALHFDLEAFNTLDIITEMEQQRILDPDSAALLQRGVAALYMLRVRLQSIHQTGCDDAWLVPNVRLPAAQLTLEEKRWLEKIWRLILRPLYQQCTADSLPPSFSLLAPFGRAGFDAIVTAEESQALAPVWKDYTDYLLLYKDFDRVQELYYQLSQKESLEPLRQAMQAALASRRRLIEKECQKLLNLAHVPNQKTGFRYSYWQAYQQLDACLKELTSAKEVASSEGIKVKIETMAWDGACLPFPNQAAAATVVTRYLKPQYMDFFLDQGTRKQALQGQVQEHTALWLHRQYPGSLHRVVQLQTPAGKGLHFKERPTHSTLEFAIVSLFYRLFDRGATPSILAKLVIELPNGASYATSLAISLSQTGTLLSDLIKKGKGQLKLDPQQVSEQLIAHILILPSDAHGGNLMCTTGGGLLSLDLEASFVPMRLPSNATGVAFVSELFCQNLIPALAKETLVQFQRLQIGPLLTGWLQELAVADQAWSQLFAQESAWLQEPLTDPQDRSLRQLQSLSHCLLPAGTMARLYQQMVHLQGFFKKREAPLSPLQLLSQLLTCWESGPSSQVGEYLAERYRQSQRSYLFFTSPPEQRLAAATGRSIQFSQSATITLQQLIDTLPTKEESLNRSPAHALQELLRMRSFYEGGSKPPFQGQNKPLTLQFDQKCPLAEEVQRMFLRLLLSSREIVCLSLPHFTLLTDQLLDQLIKNNAATLKALNLAHCHYLSQAPLLRNLEALQQLEKLSLVGQTLVEGLFNQIAQPTPLRRLKKLSIKDGTGVQLVALHAPELEQVSIQIEGDLTLKLAGKPRLKRLDVSCQKLEVADFAELNWQTLEYVHLKLAQPFPFVFDLLQQTRALQHCVYKNSAKGLPHPPRLAALSFLKINRQSVTAQLASVEALPEVISLLQKCPLIAQNKGRAFHFTFAGTGLITLSLIELPPLVQARETSRHFSLSLHGWRDLSVLPETWARLSSHFAPCPLSLELTLTRCRLTDPKTLVDALKSLPLTKLALDQTPLKDTGAELLAQALCHVPLTHLSLIATGITGPGASALVRGLPPSLTQLDLRSNHIGATGAKALAQALPPSLTQLDLRSNHIGATGAQALAQALPPSLTQLDLRSNHIGATGAQALARALPQTSITQLNLRYNYIEDAGAQALARALPQTSITQLNLGYNHIEAAGAQALAWALPQTSITQLNLRYNHIWEAGAQALARALPKTSITRLDLTNNGIDDAGTEALARALPKTSITQLNLGYNHIWDAEAQALARALPPSITQLDLDWNRIGAAGAEALARALPQTSITQLNLRANGIKAAGAETLARALPQTSITQLNLHYNRIGTAGAEALARALPQTSITQLDLGENGIGDAEAQALAPVLPQTSITQLDLDWNRIGAAGAEALARALPKTSITQLNLSGNSIGAAGAEALAPVLPQTSITHLNLRANSIGTAGAEALALALPPSITELNLEGNSIGAAGVEALARALPQTSITELNLGGNKIGTAGAEALARALPQTSITKLNLRDNSIGDAGAQALARALPQTSVTQLNLWDNSIGDAGAEALARALPQTSITQLNLARNSIGAAGTEALALALPQTSITQLNLYHNSIGAAGAEALALALPPSITELNLEGNSIGAAGVEALARALPQTSITELNLEGNSIGAAGAEALARALPQTSITKLNLRDNSIGDAGAQALARALPSSITELDLKGNSIGDVGRRALDKVETPSLVISYGRI